MFQKTKETAPMGGREAPTPVLAFRLEEGSADLFIDGERKEYWLPLMFANLDLRKCGLSEPEDPKDMAIVQISKDMKQINLEYAASKVIQELSHNDFRHMLANSDEAKKSLL